MTPGVWGVRFLLVLAAVLGGSFLTGVLVSSPTVELLEIQSLILDFGSAFSRPLRLDIFSSALVLTLALTLADKGLGADVLEF